MRNLTARPRPKFRPLAWLMWLLFILGCWLSVGIPASTAQIGTLQVNLIQVDSSAFPQVTAYVTVTDENGLPVTGLQAADFTAVEDNLPVAANSLTVESDTISGLQLVLGVDLSTTPESLAQVKAAAKTFIAALRPEDKVALVAYYDDFRIIYNFTNNITALQAALDSLTLQGNWTALYRTIFEAGKLLEPLPPGRKAVILLNDKRNNIGDFPVQQALDQLRAARAPLYVLGLEYTDKIVRADLKPLDLPASGKIVTVLASPDQIQPQLETIAAQLRQGYRLTFSSQLQADNAEHNLSIVAATPTNSGQGQGQFTAISVGQVTVALAGLTDGQTVGGIVTLTAQVTAPAPVSSLEYLLDGQLLQQIATPPYLFEWDSTSVATGAHTLTARATDTAGHHGQTELRLNVVPPLVITILTPKTEIEQGETVSLQTIIEAVAEVTAVELWLDGRPLQQHNAPPYDFSLSSADYTPGEHIVTVQAQDRFGRSAQGSLTLQFLAPPPPRFTWLRPVLITAVILLAGLLLLLLAWLLLRRRVRTHKFALTLANNGNIATPYKLRAEEPSGMLKFTFLFGGAPLMAEPAPEPKPVAASYAASVTAAPVPANGTAAVPQPGQPRERKVKMPEGGGNPLKKAGDTLGCIGSILSPFATLAVTIATFLPSAIGEPLQRWANAIVQKQTQVQSQVSYTKSNIDTTKSTFQSAGGKLAAAVPAKSGQAVMAEAVPPPLPVNAETVPLAAIQTQARVAAPVPVTPPAQTRRDAIKVVNQPEWFWTSTVQPGHTLQLDMLIRPLKPGLAQLYTFSVTSRPAEAVDAPTIIEHGELEVKPPLPLWRLLAVLLFIIMAVVILVVTVLAVIGLLNIDSQILKLWFYLN